MGLNRSFWEANMAPSTHPPSIISGCLDVCIIGRGDEGFNHIVTSHVGGVDLPLLQHQILHLFFHFEPLSLGKEM